MFYLLFMCLIGVIILCEGEFCQWLVVILCGWISKGLLLGVDLEGYLILFGIVDLLFVLLLGIEFVLCLCQFLVIVVCSGIIMVWVMLCWGWDYGYDVFEVIVVLLYVICFECVFDLCWGLWIESVCMECMQVLVDLIQVLCIELVWFESEFVVLLDQQKYCFDDFVVLVVWLGIVLGIFVCVLDGVVECGCEMLCYLCCLVEGFDDICVCYGSIGDDGGVMCEMYLMIGVGFVVCFVVYLVVVVVVVMGDFVLLFLCEEECLCDFLCGGLGDVIILDGVFEGMVVLVLLLVCDDLVDLLCIWDLMLVCLVEIMWFVDCGWLDYGCCVDLVIVLCKIGKVEMIISGG